MGVAPGHATRLGGDPDGIALAKTCFHFPDTHSSLSREAENGDLSSALGSLHVMTETHSWQKSQRADACNRPQGAT
jgi:hypothetical protein